MRRTTRLATPALLIGANLPDVDAVASLLGADLMYGFRRGWTHGVLAVVVLPVMLWGGLLLFARLRPAGERAPPLHAGRLLSLAYLGVLSHPLLDWLNNYGVRLLMPLQDRWFYGDAIFIVDPWMWLSMASAVVLARSQRRLSQVAWGLLGIACTAVVLGAPLAPWPAKLVWGLLLSALLAARVSARVRGLAEQVAAGALALLALYIAMSVGGSLLARGQALSFLAAQGLAAEHVVAGPVAANPFRRDVIARVGDRYHFMWVDWLAEPEVWSSQPPLAINRSQLARSALAAPEIGGFAHWLRLPAFEVEARGPLRRVWIRDVRYSRLPGAAIGTAWVDFDATGARVGAGFER